MLPEELHKVAVVEQEKQRQFHRGVEVCIAAGCLSLRSAEIKDALAKELKQRQQEKRCAVVGVGCMGLCSAGPLVCVRPEGTIYRDVPLEGVCDIIRSLDDGAATGLASLSDLPFLQRQRRIVLENSGRIDPDRIESYLAAGGYEALFTAINEMTPAEVRDHVLRSGLRGRGGGGYPTGLKWGTVAKSPGERKFVICNADEGDPGAFMDRSVLESDPHRVLEGMTIAAYAVGATQGYVYIRAEYPLAVKRLRTAIQRADRLGMLGNNIGATTFGFHVDVRLGAGAFVCGEETSLIASIEGLRGTPRSRPPYPAESGLWGAPTLINNVETFANIAPIIRNGGAWFAAIGTEKSKGTKVFALAGRVNNTGLIEVPMGITLREIIFEIGGGIPDGRRFKAVQTGGPSGGCIPEQYLDMPVDYDSLVQAGSIMGSGGMIVMDESSCMVDVAKYFMDFCMTESCGKCIPCRVGTYQMHRILSAITTMTATDQDLTMLEELCDLLKHTSLCGLGQSAPNPVVSTLRYFAEEYRAHIHDHNCVAGVCGGKSEPESAAVAASEVGA